MIGHIYGPTIYTYIHGGGVVVADESGEEEISDEKSSNVGPQIPKSKLLYSTLDVKLWPIWITSDKENYDVVNLILLLKPWGIPTSRGIKFTTS